MKPDEQASRVAEHLSRVRRLERELNDRLCSLAMRLLFSERDYLPAQGNHET